MASTINASTSSGLVQSGDTSGVLQLQTNSGQTAVTIDTSQNVGIGTNTPVSPLHVVGQTRIYPTSEASTIAGAANTFFVKRYTNDSRLVLGYTSNPGAFVINSTYGSTGSTTPILFAIDDTERMRIDSSGRVLVGTSSASGAQLDVVDSTGNNNYALTIARSVTDASSKSSAISIRHWLNAEEPVCLIGAGIDGNTNNDVRMGGGFSNLNSATNLQFYTAANNATTTGTERMRIDSSGNVLVTNPAGLGYGTGSGGTVTQATSRTTAVTLNKPTGAITMFSAAGSATWSNFLVNNSLVSITDTIVLSYRTGATNTYGFHVGNVQNGSFNIIFSALSGTATDAPVINFAIIKGAVS